VLLPVAVPLPEPEVPLAVEFPLPTRAVPVPVLPPVVAVRAVEAVKTVVLAAVVAPVVTKAVPLAVDTADAVAVTVPLVLPLIASAQNCMPTLVIWLVSVPPGQDSVAQSRTPKPKFMFVQRQVMLLLAHPRPGANASMLLMHVLPQGGRPLIALRSWARARLANSAAVARKSCIVV